VELHSLTYARLEKPLLSPDDPTAIVWVGPDDKPDVIAKRVGPWCWFRIERVATYRFPIESPDLAVSCVADPDEGSSRSTIVDSYYRTVIPLALQVYGLEAMHGTAVETPAGAVALCGRTHAGKTTLTYALSRRGNRLLADDGLVIDAAAPARRVALQPIPFALMIREATAEHFGTPVREYVTVDDAVTRVDTVPPVPLAAVVMLDRVETGDLAVHALSKSEAYLSLLNHCYVFSLEDAARKARMMSAYARFANTVPVFRLTYPNGLERLDEAAAAVEELAASVPRQAESASP
jgi:hypothetical protein